MQIGHSTTLRSLSHCLRFMVGNEGNECWRANIYAETANGGLTRVIEYSDNSANQGSTRGIGF